MIESKLNYLKKNFAIFYHSYQNVSFRTYVIPNTVQILYTPPILLLCHCQRYLWILQSKAKVLKLFWLNLDNNSKNVREDFENHKLLQMNENLDVLPGIYFDNINHGDFYHFYFLICIFP